MKKPLYISLIVLLAQSAFPSIVAYDTAADATYNGGAYNGHNGGYGFQSWIVNTGGGGSGGSWDWMKTVDRRTRVGADIQMIEEWMGSADWDSTLYP